MLDKREQILRDQLEIAQVQLTDLSVKVTQYEADLFLIEQIRGLEIGSPIKYTRVGVEYSGHYMGQADNGKYVVMSGPPEARIVHHIQPQRIVWVGYAQTT